MKIYLTNLGKYNEGKLIGKWIELPVDNQELEQHLLDIGINEKYEEYFISDSECELSIKINEYDNIDTLNKLAIEIDNIYSSNNFTFEEFSAFFEVKDISVDDLIFHGAEYFMRDAFIIEANNYNDLGAEYIDTLYGSLEELPREVLEAHFDYGKYARDLNFVFTSNGYAVNNG